MHRSEKESARKAIDQHPPETVEPEAAHGDAFEGDGRANAQFNPQELDGEKSATTEAKSAAPDPFDPAALRLSQDFGASLGVRKALLSVPVGKPDKSWFVRVHPSEEYHLQTATIKLKTDRGNETYLIAPALWQELATEPTFKPELLATAISRQGVLFLWEANLPRPDGRVDEWTRTALEAMELATKRWVRFAANMSLGAYEVHYATGQLPEPEWPDVPFRELLRVAFRDRFINSLDHPVLRRLRGEM
jgi:hypothetical protein